MSFRTSGRFVAASLAAITLLAPPPEAQAQVFTQPYVGLGYADGFTALAGLNFMKDLAVDEDALVDEPGPVLNWFAAAGLRTHDTQATGELGLGVVFPTGGANLGYIGPIAIGSVHPWGGGGGVRLAGGFGAGLAWLTAGVIKLDRRSGVKAIVSLDLTKAFICDVTPLC